MNTHTLNSRPLALWGWRAGGAVSAAGSDRQPAPYIRSFSALARSPPFAPSPFDHSPPHVRSLSAAYALPRTTAVLTWAMQEFSTVPKAEVKNMNSFFEAIATQKYDGKKMVVTNFQVC